MNKPQTRSVCLPGLAGHEVIVHRTAFQFWRAIEKMGSGIAPAIAMMLISPLVAAAQGNAVPARVTDRVDLTRLTTLQGNTHPLAQARYDQGAAPPDLPMSRMMLLLKRSPEQEAALQDLLEQQQITSSANYHKWLTPDQFGQQFGVADADIQAVTSWLASFGFQSIKVAKGRNVIEFSGTASQVEAGLHTSIHKYFVNGENHWANSSDPQIPTALAPVIAGVVSLHDFRPKPTMVRSDRKATLNVTPGTNPQRNFCTVSQTPCPAADVLHALVPADFNTIYNVPSTMTGSGVTIGIIATSNTNVSDVSQFRSLWGLPTKDPNVILNGPDPGIVSGAVPGSGPDGEAVLDATWAGAVAPQATVDLVVSEDTNASQGTDLSEFYIIDNNLADVMTESFESCELQFGAQGSSGLIAAANFYSGMAEQAAAQGITYLVASGDGGPDACNDPSIQPATITASVNILASTPFTVAVGGTQFFDDVTNPNTYWGSNGLNGGSALKYIPEKAWNESCTALSSTCPAVGLWSSGGGQSIAFPKPIWQSGPPSLNIPSANARFVPDVSLTAAGHDGYVICLDGSCSLSPHQFAIFSGTSASVQTFGGIMALVLEHFRTMQGLTARIGLANYALYNLAANETYANCNGSTAPSPASLSTCIFNDITFGDTNVPGEAGFTAGAGYDETTGLGSVNVSNLVNQWNTAVTKGTTTGLTLNNGTAVNIMHGMKVAVGITVSPVAPATGTPTGDVSLIANSSTDMGVDGFTLTNGFVNSNSNSTILLPGGTYQVHAHYEGDGTFLGSDSSPAINVTVNPEASQINFGIVVNSAATGCTATSITYGSPHILTVDVSDLNAVPASTPCSPNVSGSFPTGTVTLTDSFNGGTAQPLDGGSFKLNSFGYFEDQPIQLAAGTHTIKATYLGDNSFSGSGPATGVITVGKATTTTSVAANPTTVSSGAPVTLTATIATQSNATANSSQEPTGTVQFLVNNVAFGAPVTVVGGVNSNTLFAQATATVSPTNLANGQDMITAQYSGDSNYTASTTSTSVTVTVGNSGINVSPGCGSSTITISAPGMSGSCLITATGANGFSGNVTLSAAVSGGPSGYADAPTCSFGAPDLNFTAPSTITLTTSSETGNATMTCSTMAPARIQLRPNNRPSSRGWPLAGAAISLFCFFYFLTLPRQRRWGFVPLALLLAMVSATVVSCGSSSYNGGGKNPGTTVGAYTLTVTATPSTGTAQTTTITVNVQ